jgi:hypothetical protein
MATKLCGACARKLPLSQFYWNKTAQCHASRCKKCHNAACWARRKNDPAYRARQYQAKLRWTQRNPVAKREHEGRATFTRKDPEEWQAAEALLCRLWSVIQ